MRLIYVTSSFPFGPGEVFIVPELDSLQQMGHELLVVPLWPHGEVVHEDAARWLPRTLASPLVSIEIIRSLLVRLSCQAWSVGRLAHLFDCRRLSVTLKNLTALPKCAWLAEVAQQWGADHIHAFWASTVASLAWGAAELSGTPWSFTAHRFDIAQNNLFGKKVSHARFVRFIAQNGIRMSESLAGDVKRKAVTVHLGVQLRPIASEVAPKTGTVALCAASLIPVKSHSVLIDAVDRLRSRGVALELWLAGDGELHDALLVDVQRRQLGDRVRFLGVLSHSALLDLYATHAVDMVVLASADLGDGLHEGIPASLMEAMAFGIPVIGTETGGIPELLSDGAGLIVPANDPASLANALQRLSQDEGMRASIGYAGWNRIQESFETVNIALQMSRLFSSANSSAR